jgi:hypothetical protein
LTKQWQQSSLKKEFYFTLDRNKPNRGFFCMKKEYKNLVLPIPRSGNYMRFDELVEMLSKHGVQEKTIEQIHSEITASKINRET